MFVYRDRVKETTTSTGTGTLSLGGASSGYRSFASAIGNGNTCTYCIVSSGGSWEVGIGTVTSGSPDTLSRTTVIASSNANAAVSFASGDKDVFVTLPAEAVSPHVSTTAPSILIPGRLWLDTTVSPGTLYVYADDGGGLDWLPVGGGSGGGSTVLTTNRWWYGKQAGLVNDYSARTGNYSIGGKMRPLGDRNIVGVAGYWNGGATRNVQVRLFTLVSSVLTLMHDVTLSAQAHNTPFNITLPSPIAAADMSQWWVVLYDTSGTNYASVTNAGLAVSPCIHDSVIYIENEKLYWSGGTITGLGSTAGGDYCPATIICER